MLSVTPRKHLPGANFDLVVVRTVRNQLCLVLDGEFDAVGASALRRVEPSLEGRIESLILDASMVTLFSAAGVHQVLRLATSLPSDTRLVILASSAVEWTLRLVGLLDLLECRTVGEAAALARADGDTDADVPPFEPPSTAPPSGVRSS